MKKEASARSRSKTDRGVERRIAELANEPEDEEIVFKGPLPHYPDRRNGKETWKWDDDRTMLAWLVSRLEAEEDLYYEMSGIDDDWDAIRDPEVRAMRAFDNENDVHLIAEVLKSDKELSPRFRSFLAHLLTKRRAARKSLKTRQDVVVQQAIRDAPRITLLWKKFFKENVRASADRAIKMAVQRQIGSDNEAKVATLTETVANHLKRGANARQRA